MKDEFWLVLGLSNGPNWKSRSPNWIPIWVILFPRTDSLNPTIRPNHARFFFFFLLSVVSHSTLFRFFFFYPSMNKREKELVEAPPPDALWPVVPFLFLCGLLLHLLPSVCVRSIGCLPSHPLLFFLSLSFAFLPSWLIQSNTVFISIWIGGVKRHSILWFESDRE